MGGSCTRGKLPRIKKKKRRNQNEAELQQSSGPSNEQNIEQTAQPNQPLVDNLQTQQGSNQTKIFTFAQMVAATNNFDEANVLGEGGFGKVYKGKLQENDQIVAIKKLDPDGFQGIDEFIVEIRTLSLVDHPNLVKLIGYCCEAAERLLVYEYLPLGSLDDHLHGLRHDSILLDWNARIKIAAGTARGLVYLHDEMNPPIIYRDLKSSNILLDRDFHVKLSDFGLAKVGPVGEDSHVLTRVMGTYGYCAPDYAKTGHLTFKSDIYSFGVVLLELMTGRVAFDETKQGKERNIVFWARPMLEDRRKFLPVVDPVLDGKYPLSGLYEVLDIAALCVQTQPNLRPSAADVLVSLNNLASTRYQPETPRLYRSASV